MRLALISDTHMPRGERRLPQRCVEVMRDSDLVLHAGDICTTSVLEQLRRIGPPVHAVHGNVDEPALQRELPSVLEIELEGVRVAMLHDAGPARGRVARLRARFPAAALVVFGHSHLPLHVTTAPGGLQIFNPGSPTERRRAPRRTMGVATVSAGEIVATHVEF